MHIRNRLIVFGVALVAQWAHAAVAPFVQFVAAPVAPGTCTASGPTPVIAVNADLGSAPYRYSPAYVVPYFFDDEGEFNLVWNQDATLLVSEYTHLDGPRLRTPLPLAPLSAWFAGFGRVPERTELALRVAAYGPDGRAVATSRITWDCTSGAILRLEHRGNAAGPAPVHVVEYFHARLDHYFMTADPMEAAALDAGIVEGWDRTGASLSAVAEAGGNASPVCRFYVPPSSGDSHFYSASPAECAEVRAKFPSFVAESASVFAAPLPDADSGECTPGLRPVYRLWNARADTNHRYTDDPSVRVAMIARGYVAEGFGPYGVAFCALP